MIDLGKISEETKIKPDFVPEPDDEPRPLG